MTESPLRAFLMMRTVGGTWTVSVCRDLSTIMHIWKTRREPNRTIAVLHVGFDRPPSHIFDPLTSVYLGHMLLTTAAKFTLPRSFITSTTPVALAGDTEVFLGLQGWGYSVKDPTNCVQEKSCMHTLSQEPHGWVASFLKENPSANEPLLSCKIYDDESYLEGESGLEMNLRHRLGLFRAHHLIGTNYEDPCELAQAAPPWLAKRDLDTLGVTVRVENVFKSCKIKTVRDLSLWTSEVLLRQQNFGGKSLSDTLQALNTALNEGPTRSPTVPNANEESQLLTEMRRSLLSFSVRERDILVRRLGFETPPETLQKVADDYNLTRERIRQIEARATKKWIRESYWDDILEQKITRLLVGRNFPLPVAGIEAIDPWFAGVSSHLEFFKNLVQTVCKNRIHFIHVDGLDYFSLMNQDLWERTVSEAKALLSSGAGQEWGEDYARLLIQNLLPETSKEFGSLLWDLSSRLCHFSTCQNGSRTLISFGRGADRLVEAILAESETPLHYTEIADRTSLRDGQTLDPRRAHSAAANVGLLLSRGTYGLARHLPLSDEQMTRIRMEAEDIVCSQPSSKQWHTSEILTELLETLSNDFRCLDKYVLNIALLQSMVLRPLGKMTWASACENTDDQTRIDIHQAITAIVKAAGHPLNTSEIKERLTAVRGVNEYFQIYPVDPLVRVQPGVWGINERDVPLSREEQRELVEELVRRLDDKQFGIHVSELHSVLPLQDCPPYAFLSIAVQDKRLKVAQGRHVYLTKWGTPRRETIGQAVSAVLESATKLITLEEITASVEFRVGRQIDKPTISGLLQVLEAEFDDTLRKWSLSKSSAINDDPSKGDLSSKTAEG